MTDKTITFPLTYKEATISYPYKEERDEFKRSLEKLFGRKLTLKTVKNKSYGDPAIGDWIIDIKE